MAGKMTRSSYVNFAQEHIDWIKLVDNCEEDCLSLEARWIILVIEDSIKNHYDIPDQIQPLKTRAEELEMALAGVRELMGEEHTYWACYPAQGPHNEALRDYTKAWCNLIDRLIEGETFEEFTLTDEVDKYFKKEQQQ